MAETWEKIQVVELTTDTHKALKVVTVAAEKPKADEVTVQIRYVGINASDLNSFMGGYGGGPAPFDCGLEALGEVTVTGENAATKGFKTGDVVVFKGLGSWANFKNVHVAAMTKVPSVDPKYLTLSISAMTAATSVGEQSEAKAGDVAVVTAAAGGFGQFAVQLLKAKGVTVVGTCSSAEKGEFLKSLGVDRVVDYKKEKLGDVLKAEYPNGANIVYECVGGEIYDQCLANLAIRGRFIVIGSITGYKEQKFLQEGQTPVPAALLGKSASMKGFFLPHFPDVAAKYEAELIPAIESGAIKAHVDSVKTFTGLGQVADAVEHMFSGKSFGKVVVKI